MTIDTNKLRELAQNATPGPWETCEADETAFEILTGEWSAKGDFEGTIVVHVDSDAWSEERPSGITSKANAQYIAAANPATVLALLDELTRTQGSAAIASAALSAAEREVQRLRAIEAAARNYVQRNGRNNIDPDYQKLVEVLGRAHFLPTRSLSS